MRRNLLFLLILLFLLVLLLLVSVRCVVRTHQLNYVVLLLQNQATVLRELSLVKAFNWDTRSEYAHKSLFVNSPKGHLLVQRFDCFRKIISHFENRDMVFKLRADIKELDNQLQGYYMNMDQISECTMAMIEMTCNKDSHSWLQFQDLMQKITRV